MFNSFISFGCNMSIKVHYLYSQTTWKGNYRSTNITSKGNESENSLLEIEEISVGQAHENTRKLYRNISTGMAVFINQKRANVCEHTTKMASLGSL